MAVTWTNNNILCGIMIVMVMADKKIREDISV